ncbi:MFS transporter [Rhodococcus maanshanensis]|uniref:Major Facilitator Superfamily protein n=1 Tax=Rhodococcus maanshanensis TaxID=183556 RepID=A0A1H7WQY5_9NOCA|nr:MFS transporter [Rhodococcus maanshanensis]SEM23922.1 Major Facilitator Superfamily protein [Rhodococcus maanshanensis]
MHSNISLGDTAQPTGGTGEASDLARPGWNWRLALSLAALVAVLEVAALSYPLVGMAIPDIATHFHTTQDGWIMTAFVIVGAAASPMIGKLADLHGTRQVLLSCIVLSGIGALLCAVATNYGTFLVGRCLSGLMVPCLFLSYSLIRDVFPPSTVALAASIATSAVGLALVPAPFLTEWLVGDHEFRGLFWFMGLALGALAIAVVLTTPESPVRLRARVGVLGASVLGTGIAGLLGGVSQGPVVGWTAAVTLALLGTGIAAIAIWVVTAAATRDALIDIRLWRRRPVLLTALAAGCIYAVTSLYSMLLPMLTRTPAMLGLGYGFGVDEQGAAAFQVPIGVMGVLGGIVVGVLVGRHVASPGLLISLGMVSAAIGCTVTAYAHDNELLLMILAGAVGLGSGLAYAATPNLVFLAVPPELQASTSALVGMFQTVVPAIAPILAFAVMDGSHVAQLPPMITSMLNGATVYTDDGFTVGFLIAAAIALVGLCAAVLVPRRIVQVDVDSIVDMGQPVGQGK